MKKHLISIAILTAYSAILIKVMVFKDIPTIRIGHMMFNFGGPDANGQANFLPFKTILPYLLGYKGWVIAGINLFGNIGLLVPVGFLIPLACQKMTWKKTLIIAVASGLIIEGMQVIFRVGIFDIDDVILNGLGVIIGYWIFATFAKLARSCFKQSIANDKEYLLKQN
jgi:glycopeptide antibiotics resistance protein